MKYPMVLILFFLRILQLNPAQSETPYLYIVRDHQGIPHIEARDIKGAMYGLGYSMAEDRLFQMHLQRRWAQGRLSEILGNSGNAFFDERLLRYDKIVRLLNYSGHNKKIYFNLSEQRQKVLINFARGVNDYMKSLTGKLPSSFARFEITSIESWSPQDALDVWSYVGNLFGGNNIQQELDNYKDCSDGACTPFQCGTPKPLDQVAASVPRPRGGVALWPPSYDWSTLQKPPHKASSNQQIDPDIIYFQSLEPRESEVSLKASHGWAVRGNRTTTGKPLLSIDPKIRVHSPTFFYPFKLSVNGFNVRGTGFAGAPAFLAFWNEFLGQTPTSSGGDFVDLFEYEEISKNQYQIGNQVYNYRLRREMIRDRLGNETSFEIKETLFGSVLPEGLFNNMKSGKHYFLRHLEHIKENDHSFFKMHDAMWAKNLDEYTRALNGYVFPSVNLVYAGLDEEEGPGDIAYFLGSGIPRRKALVVQRRDLRGRYPIQVQSVEDIWNDQLSIFENPHVINREEGIQVSANDLSVADWYYRFQYPGTAGAGNTHRGFQVKTELQEALLDDGKISPEEMKRIQLSGQSEVVESFKDMLMVLFDAGDLGDTLPEGAIAKTDLEKAQKTLQALIAFSDQGGQIENGNRFFFFAKNIITGPQSIHLLSRFGTSGNFSCRFNEAETGVARLVREFKNDSNLARDPDVKPFLILAASRIWTLMRNNDFDEDFNQWPLNPPIEETVVSQSIIFLCSELKIPQSAGVDLCNQPQGLITEIPLKRAIGNQLNAANTSMMPSMVDFSNIETSVSYLPFGISEIPESPLFGSNIETWLLMGEGRVEAFPRAPLKTQNLVDVISVKRFEEIKE